jgi:recombination protein RecA
MATLQELEKKFGLEQALVDKQDTISTGSIGLDIAVGNGGLPLGKVVEAIGMESSGKSTTTLHLIAEAQKKFPDKIAALFDYENSFDAEYATTLGVNIDRLKIYQPKSQEQGYDMAMSLIESAKSICSCLIDSAIR